MLLLTFLVPAQAWWVPVILGGAIVAHAAWRILERKMDRFVITNMRVFRVHGILSQNIATMPLSRILDISVHKPIVGRVFGYGHFVFESAAQEQGLREIRFVGDPDQRGLTIQRVIQQAGLRGFAAQQQLGIQQPTAQPARQRPRVPPMPPQSRTATAGTGSPTPSGARSTGSPSSAAKTRRADLAVRSRPHEHRADRPAALIRAARDACGNIAGGGRVLIPWSVTSVASTSTSPWHRNQIHSLLLTASVCLSRRSPTPQPNKDNPLHDYRNDRPGHQAGRHQRHRIC